MSPKVEQLIAKAKKQIEACGWTVNETPGRIEGEVHLVLMRDGKRKGWGQFDRLFCWIGAYETITGKSWLSLAMEQS